jgi:hypothetical protein
MVSDDVKVWYKIKKDDKHVTLKDVFEKMEEIRVQHPDLDVFFDGDEYAICSRPLQAAPAKCEDGGRHRAVKEKRKGRQMHLA